MRCFDSTQLIYRKLKEASGISEFLLRAFVSKFYDLYGKFPELDLIPGANSAPYLKEKLQTKEVAGINTTTTSKVLEYTGASNIREAQQKLNNEFRDLDITITDGIEDGTVWVSLRKRASIYGDLYERGDLDIPENVSIEDSTGIINSMVERVSNLYGTPMHTITGAELDLLRKDLPDKFNIPGITTAKAFILGGEIYINTDYASVDAPLHEFMHLIIGQLKTSDPETYKELLESTIQIQGFENKLNSEEFKNRSLLDVAEEVLVTEYAQYITDPFYKGFFDVLNDTSKEGKKFADNFFYNITRAIDNVLIPKQSSATEKNNYRILARSVMDLARILGSTMVIPERLGTLQDSEEHRRLSNKKRELLENKLITRECR